MAHPYKFMVLYFKEQLPVMGVNPDCNMKYRDLKLTADFTGSFWNSGKQMGCSGSSLLSFHVEQTFPIINIDININIDALCPVWTPWLFKVEPRLYRGSESFYLMFEMKAGPTNGGLDLMDFLKNSFY